MCVSGKRWCACAGVAGVAAMHVTRHSCHTLGSRHFLTSDLFEYSFFIYIFFIRAYLDDREFYRPILFYF